MGILTCRSHCYYGSGSGSKGSTQKGMVSMAPRGGKPEEYQYFFKNQNFEELWIRNRIESGSLLRM